MTMTLILTLTLTLTLTQSLTKSATPRYLLCGASTHVSINQSALVESCGHYHTSRSQFLGVFSGTRFRLGQARVQINVLKTSQNRDHDHWTGRRACYKLNTAAPQPHPSLTTVLEGLGALIWLPRLLRCRMVKSHKWTIGFKKLF